MVVGNFGGSGVEPQIDGCDHYWFENRAPAFSARFTPRLINLHGGLLFKIGNKTL
ncbi:hypothetical protein ABV508_002890 [Salmonella enterica]